MSQVPCNCPFCMGKLVSRYIRGQHSSKYRRVVVTAAGSEREPAAGGTECEDRGSDETKLVDRELEEDDTSTHVGYGTSGEDLDRPDVQNSASSSEDDSARSSESEEDCDLAPTANEDFELNIHFDPAMYERPEAMTPLFEGASISILEAVSEHLDWFTSHPGTSKEALSRILFMEHHRILPPDNKLPDSYESAMKLIKPYLIEPITYHACRNDCILFRNDYASSLICPICHEPRYKYSTVPYKKFVYLPIRPRLERIFGTAHLSQLMQAHMHVEVKDGQDILDIQHTIFWRDCFAQTGVFKGDSHGIGLSLCTDGVNPFSHQRVTYSMWPLMMTILNMPRNIRNAFGNILLLGIIPGTGKKEPASLNPYLEVVVDELFRLNDSSMFDAYLGAPFHVKVRLMLYVLDYPGVCKVFHTSGSGAYKGCMWCDITGTYNKQLRKMVYLQNRTFLAPTSTIRTETDGFPSHETEMSDAPPSKKYEEVKAFHEVFDRTRLKKGKDAIARKTGCKGCYPFMRLPDHDPLVQCAPDAMHTVKDVLERVFGLMTGKESIAKVQESEHALGRFATPEQTGPQRLGKRVRTAAVARVPYCLTKDELKLADERSLSILTPTHIDFKCPAMFCKPYYHKSHDWKQIGTQGILKYCLRGSLGRQQRQTLFRFLDCVAMITKESFQNDETETVKSELNICLSLLERDFPITLQVITLHLLHHVVEGICRLGPVYASWMYCFERFNSWMCQRVKNRANPETNVLQTYRVFEWCNFMQLSGRLSSHPKPKRNPVVWKQGVVSDFELTIIERTYRNSYLQYATLTTEYENERQKAVSSRTLSNFPSKALWKPPARLLTDTDREILSGPKNDVQFLKKLSLQQPFTSRIIDYSAADCEHKEARIVNSYVSVRDISPAVFGRIRWIFVHSFASEVTDWVVLDTFPAPEKDPDSGLWSVLNEIDHVQYVLVSDLGEPLVVANQLSTNRIWILNYVETGCP